MQFWCNQPTPKESFRNGQSLQGFLTFGIRIVQLEVTPTQNVSLVGSHDNQKKRKAIRSINL